MPSRGQSITVTYTAWDTGANGPKTGDVSNHTLRWIKDGVSAAPTNAPSEVDATNAPGEYKLTMTSTECTCDFGALSGKSSTSGVVLIPVKIAFEQLPTAAPAASNGLVTVGTGPGQITPDGTTGGVNTSEWGGTAVGSVPPDKIFTRSGTAQGGSSTTITLDAGASATNNYYIGAIVEIRSGTGAGQAATIASYVGSTKVATINGSWATSPDNTSVFSLIAAGVLAASTGVNVLQWNGVNVGSVPPDAQFLRSGTAQAGAATSITLDAGASASDGFYQDRLVFIRSGTGAGQARHISSYVGSTKVATVRRPWVTNPDNTSVFTIHADGMASDVQRGIAAAGASTTITLAAALGADNLTNGAKIRITGGTGAGQTRVIAGYVNSTKVVTVDHAWTTTPDTTSVYEIVYDDAPALTSTLGLSSGTGSRCNFEAAFTSSAGSADLHVEAWLEDQNGNQIDQAAGATCAVTFREIGTTIDALSLVPVLNTTNHRFYFDQIAPVNLTADRGYIVLVTIVDASSVTHGPTIHSGVTIG